MVIFKILLRLTERILQESLRAKRSNLSDFPKDCFVALLLAITEKKEEVPFHLFSP